MIDRKTRLRWRRRFKRKQRQVEEAGTQAEENIEQHFFKRLSRLSRVRRFLFSWVLLMLLLIGGSVVQIRGLGEHYLKSAPAEGGTFTEGIVGTFTNANPLYASTAPDNSTSKLVFSSLMKYNEDNKLVKDIASSVKVNNRGDIYTIRLKPKIKWHDGEALTAEDVAFTYDLIKNPDARSPLFSSWREVDVSVKNARTVVFELPNALTAFPHSLTNGIVPKHVLDDIPVDQLRGDRFNTVNPVGSGPFMWEELEVVGSQQDTREERIALVPNEDYHFGAPKLQRFILRTFKSPQLMLEAYERGKLNAIVGLNRAPEDLQNTLKTTDYSVPLSGAVMVFFNTSQPPLRNMQVRRALVEAVDVPELIQNLGYPAAVVKSPLLMSQLGYTNKLAQLSVDKEKAMSRLEEVGWEVGSGGIRVNDRGQPLTITLTAQDIRDYQILTEQLKNSWREIGVQVDIQLLNESEIQGTLQRHDHQALLYGISVGPDPDVFAYWHTTQTNPNSAFLNLSEYTNEKADKALEEGRIRRIPKARIDRYQTFLKEWRSDAPALALYQPRFLYIVRGNLYNFDPDMLNTPADRFTNVHNWMIREEKIVK